MTAKLKLKKCTSFLVSYSYLENTYFRQLGDVSKILFKNSDKLPGFITGLGFDN